MIVGVVSRGFLCGRQNHAGVYTRVKMALRWIFYHAGDGKCGGGGTGHRLVAVSGRKTTSRRTTRSTASTKTSSTSTTTDPSLVYPCLDCAS